MKVAVLLCALCGVLAQAAEPSPFFADLASMPVTPGVGPLENGAVQRAAGDALPGLGRAGFVINLVTLEPCSVFNPHWQNVDELAVGVEGNVTFGVVDVAGPVVGKLYEQEIGPGMIAAIPRGLAHYALNSGCEPVSFYSIFNGNNATRTSFDEVAKQMASGAVRPNLRLPAGEADPAQWDPTLLGPLGGDCAATCGL